MTQSTIASQDVVAIEELTRNLPQSLIIEAELGLDIDSVITQIVSSDPSDVHEIAPEASKTQISVGQIRTKLASLMTFAHHRRIVIIRPADGMTPEAQNSLLKTLEEPSSGLHFILISSGAGALLPTIYSRCQRYRLHRTSHAQDRELVSTFDVDTTTSHQIMFLAAGRPKLMEQLATNQKLLTNYQEIAADAKAIINSRGYEKLRLLLRHATGRDEALHLMDILLSMIKFQLTHSASNPQLAELAEKAAQTESSLRKNASVKIALLRLI